MEMLVQFKETVVPHRWGSETLRLGQSYDFWRAYSLFVARGASFVSQQMQMMLRGTQINYMPDKIHLSIIIINTNDQIVV